MAKRVRYTYSKYHFKTFIEKGKGLHAGRDRARNQLCSDLGFAPNIVKETDTRTEWVFIVEGRESSVRHR